MFGRRHLIDFIFSMALLGVFAVSALMVVILGAEVYKSTVVRMDEGFALRTSVSYVTQKVRQNDRQNAIAIGRVEGVQALVLSQTIGETPYATWIYFDDGSLKEIFARADSPVKRSDGQPLAELSDFAITKGTNGLYTFTMTDKAGASQSVTVAQRSGDAAGVQMSDAGVRESELVK